MLDWNADLEAGVVPAGEPTARSVDELAGAVRRATSPLVVGIGGGSTLDAAKLAAVVAAGADRRGALRAGLRTRSPVADRSSPSRPPPGRGRRSPARASSPIVAGRKVWAWGDELVPDLVLLDPVATATMPAHVTAATGLDAFVHAVEAVDRPAPLCHGVRSCPAGHPAGVEHLPGAVDDGDDLDGRQAMQEAALLAGLAIDAGGTGIAHSIGHALGTLAHVPHGVAVAVGLGAVIEWNVAGRPEAFASVARTLGRPVTDVPEIYAGLLRARGFPSAVARLGTSGRVGRRPGGHDGGRGEPTHVCQQLPGPRRRAACRLGRGDLGDLGRACGARRERHRPDRDQPSPAVPRSALPGFVGPRPRTHFPATIVRVFDDAGHMGVGSGDSMYGFADYERYFIGEDPLDLERHAAVLANVEFHAGRPWPLDVALWDLAGQIPDRPMWDLVGGRYHRVRAYASTGVAGRPVTRWSTWRDGRVRSGSPPSRSASAGPHARRRPGRGASRPGRGRRHARADGRLQPGLADAVGHAAGVGPRPRDPTVAQQLASEGVYWMEEPLHRGDYDGHAELRRRVDIRIAGGEMTREPYEFAELLGRGCLDVFQPDCVCTQGITGLRPVGGRGRRRRASSSRPTRGATASGCWPTPT